MNDVVVIGAGIVGLATALKLLEKAPGLKVTILEKERAIAMHQTGNNSGVIHAGVYYKPGSLKARNCLNGYKQLIDFCKREEVEYDICGKLIVATNEDELRQLKELYKRAKENGLSAIKEVPPEGIKEYEPHARGMKALYVSYTGITDYKKVGEKYLDIITHRYGGQVRYNQKVKNINCKHNSAEVITEGGAIQTKLVVNTAGLHSDKVAIMTGEKLDVRIIPFRGEYVELRPEKRSLVQNLIYPVPNPRFPFLGVHFTRKLNGGVEAGPNAVWAFKQEGYKKSSFNMADVYRAISWPGFRNVMQEYWRTGLDEYWRSYHKKALAKALSKLVPDITADDLRKGGAGVRAQACDRKGGLIDDFLMVENKWSVNVINAPSPAATASLAIGEQVAGLVLKRLF